MGWGSPVVQRADGSPIYGGRASVIMDNPQSTVQSPEQIEEIQQMPEMSLIATSSSTPATNTTTVERYTPAEIVE